MDIGSGLGKPVYYCFLTIGCKSHGIEYDQIKVDAANSLIKQNYLQTCWTVGFNEESQMNLVTF